MDEDMERGLYGKYIVQRLNDPTGKHDHCEYFVLDLEHDRHAIAALDAYARSCEFEYPQLSRDLQVKTLALKYKRVAEQAKGLL